MRLICISDTHTYLGQMNIPEGDVLIHCGDALSNGNEWEFDKFTYSLNKLANKFQVVLYIPGNHDKIVAQNPQKARRALWGNVYMLIHESCSITVNGESFKIFGSPYTPRFFDWAFMYDREEGAKRWADIPLDSDIVITHGMPYGILDLTPRLLGSEIDPHVGCVDLRAKLEEVRPKLYAGGHLHYMGGRTHLEDGTLYVNAAMCDEKYRPNRKPIIVDTKTWDVIY